MSRSSKALDKLLKEHGDGRRKDHEGVPEARALLDRFHRRQLWWYRHGGRVPTIETAQEIARLTKDRVPSDGWTATQ